MLDDILGGLLQEKIVITFPCLVEIVIMVERFDNGISGYFCAVRDNLGNKPGDLGLENSRESMNLSNKRVFWVGEIFSLLEVNLSNLKTSEKGYDRLRNILTKSNIVERLF